MTEFIKSFEELDTAMFYAFNNIVVNGKPVKVTFFTPDLDLVSLSLPGIALYRTDPYRDVSRWDNNAEYIDDPIYNSDGTLTRVNKRLAPEPWSVMYTVKTIYTNQMDGVRLTDQLLRLFPRGAYITIKGVKYDVDQLTAGLWGTQYKDFGKVEDGKRRFQETYAFRVDFYLEVDDPTSHTIVQKVGVKNIPYK